MDPYTEEPQDILTPQAQQIIQALDSHITNVSEIVAQKDPAIFIAIQEGVDRANEYASIPEQKVHTPELSSLLCRRVGMINISLN